MARPRIYVAGYPRSGTTWLCRLIADAWNCPIGSIYDPGVFHGHATEGKDRTGPFMILHGHKLPGEIVVNPADFVFFIYRDPRDVIVSISHYFDTPLKEAIRDAVNGRPGATGPRQYPIMEYVRTWLDSGVADYVTRYERLHTDVRMVMYTIIDTLGVDPLHGILGVVHRQAFGQRKTNPNSKHMRKGIVGDWRNHFTSRQHRRLWRAIGTDMERLGYGF